MALPTTSRTSPRIWRRKCREASATLSNRDIKRVEEIVEQAWTKQLALKATFRMRRPGACGVEMERLFMLHLFLSFSQRGTIDLSREDLRDYLALHTWNLPETVSFRFVPKHESFHSYSGWLQVTSYLLSLELVPA